MFNLGYFLLAINAEFKGRIKSIQRSVLSRLFPRQDTTCRTEKSSSSSTSSSGSAVAHQRQKAVYSRAAAAASNSGIPGARYCIPFARAPNSQQISKFPTAWKLAALCHDCPRPPSHSPPSGDLRLCQAAMHACVPVGRSTADTAP